MKTFKEYYKEISNIKTNELKSEVKDLYDIQDREDTYSAKFKVKNNEFIAEIDLLNDVKDVWVFKFYRLEAGKKLHSIINDNIEVASVIVTIEFILTNFLRNKNPNYLGYTAELNEKGIVRLYDKKSKFAFYRTDNFYEQNKKFYLLVRNSEALNKDIKDIEELLIRNFII